MQNTDNLKSYDGVESVQLNLSEDELQKYYDSKMESSKSNVDFILNRIYNGQSLMVEEIGSGNSKLLYGLERAGLLERGYGYEVSESRHMLANRFAELAKSSRVVNLNEDYLKSPILDNQFDLIIGVDVVMQIISPLYDDAENDFWDRVIRDLKPGGYVFLELEDFSRTINEVRESGGEKKIWEEFDESDPWRYSLHRVSIDENDNIIFEKTFIGRDDGNKRSYMKNVMKNYTRESARDLLEKKGLSVSIYSVYDSENEQKQAEVKSGGYKHDFFRVLGRKRE